MPRHAPIAFYSAVRLSDPEMVSSCGKIGRDLRPHRTPQEVPPAAVRTVSPVSLQPVLLGSLV